MKNILLFLGVVSILTIFTPNAKADPLAPTTRSALPGSQFESSPAADKADLLFWAGKPKPVNSHFQTDNVPDLPKQTPPAIPEPASAILWGVSLLGVGMIAKRKG